MTAHIYSYDAAHRRTTATREDGAFWLDGYNDRDEVISAKKHLPSGDVLAGWQQGFAYDSIGNRKSMEKGGDADGENLRVTDYTANRLNQYTQVVHPTLFDALGLAHPDATVTVNGQPADRQGAHWRKELEAGNASGPAFPEVEVEATRTGVGPGGGEVRVVERGGHFIDPVFLAPRHDADGNLLSDGRWGYTWDADNRLVAMRTHPAAVAAGVPEERYEFTYDAEWRRVRQRVWRWDEEAPGEAAGTLGAFVLVRDERTVYDGWNPVAQIDATGAVVQRHLWGLDLSGTAQGAGGVGGLLGTWDNGTTTREGLRESGPGVGNGNGNGEPRAWYVAYDGNGNVSAVITTGNGGTENRKTAFYDYEAFGKVLASWGDADLLAANRYRFSTKPEDGTGLLYYGYRYLDAGTGRWVSRDPINEEGGANLYGFVRNRGVMIYDYLGLDSHHWCPYFGSKKEGQARVDAITKGKCICDIDHYTTEIWGQKYQGSGWNGTPHNLLHNELQYNRIYEIIRRSSMGDACKFYNMLDVAMKAYDAILQFVDTYWGYQHGHYQMSGPELHKFSERKSGARYTTNLSWNLERMRCCRGREGDRNDPQRNWIVDRIDEVFKETMQFRAPHKHRSLYNHMRDSIPFEVGPPQQVPPIVVEVFGDITIGMIIAATPFPGDDALYGPYVFVKYGRYLPKISRTRPPVRPGPLRPTNPSRPPTPQPAYPTVN